MSRPILGGFGSNSRQPQAPVADDGGIFPDDVKDVMNYSPPQGPKNIMDPKSPGLHGKNHGIGNGCEYDGAKSGSPGIGGTNHGCCGSQGKY